MRPCSVDECDRAHHGLGLCRLHYKRSVAGRDIHGPSGCCVCVHPSRGSIEAYLIGGSSTIRAASDLFGLPFVSVHHHIYRHMKTGKVVAPQCSVCSHPDVDQIDLLLAERAAWFDQRGKPRVGAYHAVPKALQLQALVERFGFITRAPLSRHETPEHQQRRALYELARLNTLREDA